MQTKVVSVKEFIMMVFKNGIVSVKYGDPIIPFENTTMIAVYNSNNVYVPLIYIEDPKDYINYKNKGYKIEIDYEDKRPSNPVFCHIDEYGKIDSLYERFMDTDKKLHKIETNDLLEELLELSTEELSNFKLVDFSYGKVSFGLAVKYTDELEQYNNSFDTKYQLYIKIGCFNNDWIKCEYSSKILVLRFVDNDEKIEWINLGLLKKENDGKMIPKLYFDPNIVPKFGEVCCYTAQYNKDEILPVYFADGKNSILNLPVFKIDINEVYAKFDENDYSFIKYEYLPESFHNGYYNINVDNYIIAKYKFKEVTPKANQLTFCEEFYTNIGNEKYYPIVVGDGCNSLNRSDRLFNDNDEALAISIDKSGKYSIVSLSKLREEEAKVQKFRLFGSNIIMVLKPINNETMTYYYCNEIMSEFVTEKIGVIQKYEGFTLETYYKKFLEDLSNGYFQNFQVLINYR